MLTKLPFFVFCGVQSLPFFYYNLPILSYFFYFGFPIFLDGIDGFIARKFNQSTDIGALFDKTTDAYFVLLLSLILVQKYNVSYWFLGIGYLHYGYELVLQILGWSALKIPPNPIGKYVAVFLFISLLSPFITPSQFYLPLYLLHFLLDRHLFWDFFLV